MKILCIGKICLDIVNYMDYYPPEDSDQSIKHQRWSAGGNATNTSIVLQQLGSLFRKGADPFQCELFAAIGTDVASDYVRRVVDDVHHVDMGRCPIRGGHRNGHTNRLGTTCIIINRSSATRTIVHAPQDVDCVNYDDFCNAKFDFNQYDWIHFETRRNISDFVKMLQSVLSWREERGDARGPIVSVELEKDRPGYESLFMPGIDYFFVGKDFAKKLGCKTMQDAVSRISKLLSPATTVVCPWGEEGACVLEGGVSFECQAYQPDKAVDTLAAGDTLFASFIFSKCYLQKSSKEAIKFACLVAGLKCASVGCDDVAGNLEKVIKAKGLNYLTQW